VDHGKRLALVAAGCAVVTAACGSSSAPGKPTGRIARSEGIAFSKCMRAHGLPNFPDPIAGGGLQFSLPSGMTPQSRAFAAAQAVCNYLVPAPPGGSGGPSPGQRAADLRFAHCMRSHGVPNYPDPAYSDGQQLVKPLQLYGINPGSPAFVDGSKACKPS
jgi:hypothetical protein